MSNCDDMTHFIAVTGGVGEWLKPVVLKTTALKRRREFESRPLRTINK